MSSEAMRISFPDDADHGAGPPAENRDACSLFNAEYEAYEERRVGDSLWTRISNGFKRNVDEYKKRWANVKNSCCRSVMNAASWTGSSATSEPTELPLPNVLSFLDTTSDERHGLSNISTVLDDGQRGDGVSVVREDGTRADSAAESEDMETERLSAAASPNDASEFSSSGMTSAIDRFVPSLEPKAGEEISRMADDFGAIFCKTPAGASDRHDAAGSSASSSGDRPACSGGPPLSFPSGFSSTASDSSEVRDAAAACGDGLAGEPDDDDDDDDDDGEGPVSGSALRRRRRRRRDRSGRCASRGPHVARSPAAAERRAFCDEHFWNPRHFYWNPQLSAYSYRPRHEEDPARSSDRAALYSP